MIYLLFIFYCVLFCWLITRIKFFTESGLSKWILIILFFARILSLVIGSYLNLYYFPSSDSVTFHKMGINQFNLLFKYPYEYFVNIFHSGYPDGYGRLLDDYHSFWNNLRSNLLAKMLSIFDLFSFKNFFINTLFYNFLIFFGVVALYRVFIKIFPTSSSPLIICIFLFPSALFFSSMIHRDGFIFLSLSMIIYHLSIILSSRQFSWKRIFIILSFLILIFLLRNFVFIALLPALFAWILAKKYPKYAFIIFIAVYTITIILFFSSGYFSPRMDLPQYVSSRQKSFIEIGKAGNSTIDINSLYPNFRSFLHNLPQAFNHVLMRPYIFEITSFEYVPFAIEIFIIEILFILFLLFRKGDKPINPLIYFCVFFSFSMLLLTGYIVPIIGAIVRYRSIYLLFLILPLVGYIDWKRIIFKQIK